MTSVLVVGSGAREHALAWRLSISPGVSRVVVAPGNDGFSTEWERWPVRLGEGRAEFARLAERALSAGVRLAVIGPDNPLADGIVDEFERQGVAAFGPRAAAARIEASKAFAKDVMRAAGIPTAAYHVAGSFEDAREFLHQADWKNGAGWVVKADGLALGKGVRVCSRVDEAIEAARELIAVSGSLVIEERLSGEEISWLALCDGTHAALLEPARDYKRVGDGDQGPNTGGMGAFSPVPGVPVSWRERVRKEVFEPALRELKKRGAEFRGVLYAGLMADLKRDRFWVLEFNARFGDPETQVLMPRIEGDLLGWLEAAARGDLGRMGRDVPFRSEAAVYVVGAARGYPDSPEKGKAIEGMLGSAPEYFVAGVARAPSGGLMTSGGRVLGALGLGATLGAAREQAYERISRVSFEGMQFRSDIAAGAADPGVGGAG